MTRATTPGIHAFAYRWGRTARFDPYSTPINPIDDRDGHGKVKHQVNIPQQHEHKMHTQTLDHTHIATQTRGVKRRAAHAGGFLAFLALRPGWGAGGRLPGSNRPHRPSPARASAPARPRGRAPARPLTPGSLGRVSLGQALSGCGLGLGVVTARDARQDKGPNLRGSGSGSGSGSGEG